MSGSIRDVTLYVHFPYCLSRCTYCDFNTYVVDDIPNQSYTDAIVREGNQRSSDYGRCRLTSVYFGGGTPSLWGPTAIERIVGQAREWFEQQSDELEITLECNPEEATVDALHTYAEAGVTRLSLGVQSLQDNILTTIGRRHDAQRAEEAVRAALSIGFQSVSADLMFGLPGQSLATWENDLKAIANTGVPHMSLYHLTLESGTAMTRDVLNRRIHLPSEQHQDEMWDCIQPVCSEFGLHPYEISNLAKPGHESRHNVAYWLGTPYLGLGAGSHSFNPPCDWTIAGATAVRSMGIKKPQSYIARVLEGDTTAEWTESIDAMTHLRERMFTGLRYLPGISMKKIAAEVAIDPAVIFAEQLESLRTEGLLCLDNDQVRLTERGLRMANDVFLRFF